MNNPVNVIIFSCIRGFHSILYFASCFSVPGIYSPTELIDFGIIRTLDGPSTVLVICFVSWLSVPGIYSPTELIDFGIIRTLDGPSTVLTICFVSCLSVPGIYSPTELIDFGIIRTLDGPSTVHLSLLNTGSKPIHVTVSTNSFWRESYRFLRIELTMCRSDKFT